MICNLLNTANATIMPLILLTQKKAQEEQPLTLRTINSGGSSSSLLRLPTALSDKLSMVGDNMIPPGKTTSSKCDPPKSTHKHQGWVSHQTQLCDSQVYHRISEVR